MISDLFDPQKYAHEIEEQGYTLVPDTLNSDEIHVAKQAILEVYKSEHEIAKGVETQTEHAHTIHHLFAKHPVFEEFYLNNKVNAVIRMILGDDMVLSETHARSILQSSGREEKHGFQVHVDREAFSVLPFENSPHHYPMAINTAWFLVDFTEDNGATVLWPGTHKLNKVPDPDRDYSDMTQSKALGPAGTCIIWDASIWHASGKNISTHIRHSILGFYHRKWIRGTINVEHVIPPAVLARMSPEMHQLIGLYDWPPNYSAVNKMNSNQIAALTPEQREVLGFMNY